MLRTTRPVICLIACFLLSFFFVGASRAHADFEMELVSGTHSIFESTGGSTLTFAGAVGNFTVNVTTGLSNMTERLINLSSADVVTGSTGGTLTITLAETGFGPLSTANGALNSIVSGTISSGTFTFRSWESNSDLSPIAGGQPFTLPADRVTTGVQGAFSSPGVLGNTASTLFPNGTTYSLFDQFVITLPGFAADTASGLTSVTPTPAPSGLTLTLAGVPFLGLGLYFRRRRLCCA